MTVDKNIDSVITPATWKHRAKKLRRTSSDLLNLAGLYGSTHAEAMWRKDGQFLSVFQENQVVGFDPQIDEWNPGFAPIEAEVMAKASVIVLRLENNELLNGSLGSIAEIGLALTSAALRGQIVIVSIEDNLLSSLDEPGAMTQYLMLELYLEHLEQAEDLARFVRVHRGDNLYYLANMTVEAVQQQMNASQKRINFRKFLAKKERRSQNFPLRVLLAGSGGAYAHVHDGSFEQKKAYLTKDFQGEGQEVRVLSEGALAEAWKVPYGSADNTGAVQIARILLAVEAEFKREADLLLLPIMTEAASKAATSEIGFMLLHALLTGQDVRIYLEPFDPVDYVRHRFRDADIEAAGSTKSVRRLLQEVGISEGVLAAAVDKEVVKAFQVFKALKQGDLPSFAEVKRTLLGRTDAFRNADNIMRVRTIVQAHLDSLAADERFPHFFSYSNRIMV